MGTKNRVLILRKLTEKENVWTQSERSLNIFVKYLNEKLSTSIQGYKSTFKQFSNNLALCFNLP